MTEETKAPVKPWWKSKTVWFNVVATIPPLIDATASNLGLMQPIVPPESYPYIALIFTVVNLWLRSITNSQLARKEP